MLIEEQQKHSSFYKCGRLIPPLSKNVSVPTCNCYQNGPFCALIPNISTSNQLLLDSVESIYGCKQGNRWVVNLESLHHMVMEIIPHLNEANRCSKFQLVQEDARRLVLGTLSRNWFEIWVLSVSERRLWKTNQTAWLTACLKNWKSRPFICGTNCFQNQRNE